MGRLQIVIDDEVEKKFRTYLSGLGLKKGMISDVIQMLIIEKLVEEGVRISERKIKRR